MTVLERFKIELANKQYYEDATFSQFLLENDLEYSANYSNKAMRRQLLTAVLDVMESLANDMSLFMSFNTEYTNEGEAYSYLQKRLCDLQKRINAIPDEDGNSLVSYMFYG
jgi:hypothetical protein